MAIISQDSIANFGKRRRMSGLVFFLYLRGLASFPRGARAGLLVPFALALASSLLPKIKLQDFGTQHAETLQFLHTKINNIRM